MTADKFKNSLARWKELAPTAPSKILTYESRSYEVEVYQTQLVTGWKTLSVFREGDHDCEIKPPLLIVVDKGRLEKKPVP